MTELVVFFIFEIPSVLCKIGDRVEHNAALDPNGVLRVGAVHHVAPAIAFKSIPLPCRRFVPAAPNAAQNGFNWDGIVSGSILLINSKRIFKTVDGDKIRLSVNAGGVPSGAAVSPINHFGIFNGDLSSNRSCISGFVRCGIDNRIGSGLADVEGGGVNRQRWGIVLIVFNCDVCLGREGVADSDRRIRAPLMTGGVKSGATTRTVIFIRVSLPERSLTERIAV